MPKVPGVIGVALAQTLRGLHERSIAAGPTATLRWHRGTRVSRSSGLRCDPGFSKIVPALESRIAQALLGDIRKRRLSCASAGKAGGPYLVISLTDPALLGTIQPSVAEY